MKLFIAASVLSCATLISACQSTPSESKIQKVSQAPAVTEAQQQALEEQKRRTLLTEIEAGLPSLSLDLQSVGSKEYREFANAYAHMRWTFEKLEGMPKAGPREFRAWSEYFNSGFDALTLGIANNNLSLLHSDRIYSAAQSANEVYERRSRSFSNDIAAAPDGYLGAYIASHLLICGVPQQLSAAHHRRSSASEIPTKMEEAIDALIKNKCSASLSNSPMEQLYYYVRVDGPKTDRLLERVKRYNMGTSKPWLYLIENWIGETTKIDLTFEQLNADLALFRLDEAMKLAKSQLTDVVTEIDDQFVFYHEQQHAYYSNAKRHLVCKNEIMSPSSNDYYWLGYSFGFDEAFRGFVNSLPEYKNHKPQSDFFIAQNLITRMLDSAKRAPESRDKGKWVGLANDLLSATELYQEGAYLYDTNAYRGEVEKATAALKEVIVRFNNMQNQIKPKTNCGRFMIPKE